MAVSSPRQNTDAMHTEESPSTTFPVLLGPMNTVSGRKIDAGLGNRPEVFNVQTVFTGELGGWGSAYSTATSTAALKNERGQGDASLRVG